MFGGNMEARVYQQCLIPNENHHDDSPVAEILHESYYECKIYISLWSTTACTAADVPSHKQHPKEGGTLATIGILAFVGMAMYVN